MGTSESLKGNEIQPVKTIGKIEYTKVDTDIFTAKPVAEETQIDLKEKIIQRDNVQTLMDNDIEPKDDELLVWAKERHEYYIRRNIWQYQLDELNNLIDQLSQL